MGVVWHLMCMSEELFAEIERIIVRVSFHLNIMTMKGCILVGQQMIPVRRMLNCNGSQQNHISPTNQVELHVDSDSC